MHLYKFFASLFHVPEYKVAEGEPEARSEEEPPVEGHNHEHQRVGEHNWVEVGNCDDDLGLDW